MKHFKGVIFFFGVVLLLSSCLRQKYLANYSAYNKYLTSVINDTVFFEFSEYKIVDKSIYPILDSVILLSENCKYFDEKVKYLSSFKFGTIYKEDKSFYSIDAHLSPAQAIGLILLETGTIKQIKAGVFYYRNYLFVIPSSNVGEQNELTFFPFIKKTEKILRIRAPEFFDEKVYSSYVTFSKVDSSYKIIENKICGSQILIQ